jgi:hypothetical protein
VTLRPLKLDARTLAIYVILTGYLLLSFLWFTAVVKPAMAGLNPIRFGADSATYMEVAKRYTQLNLFSDTAEFLALVTVEGNFLGPVLLLKALELNLWLVIALNCFLFLVSVWALLESFNIDCALFIALLLLNPMLLPTLFSVNKEILGFAAIAMFIRQMTKPNTSKLVIALTIVLAFAVRWQQAFVQLGFFLLRGRLNPWHKRRGATVMLVILAITILYPMFASHALNRNGADLIAAPSDVPTLGALSTLQDHYLFPLALPPKALANLTGPMPGIQYFRHRLSSLDYSDWFVMYIVPGHQFVPLIALLILFKRGNYRPSRWTDGTYFAILYLIVFSVSPFIQARYFFPIFGLICAAAAQRNCFPGKHDSDPTAMRMPQTA